MKLALWIHVKAVILAILLSTQSVHACPGSTTSQDVDLITIRSSWYGLGGSSESILSIRQKSGTFFANGKKIDKKLIDELLLQIDNHDTQTPESLGISSEWLIQNANKAIPSQLKRSLPVEREFFVNSFRNIDLIKQILPRMFSRYSTDDYPKFEMKISERDGSEMVVSSMSQHLFMFNNPKLGKAIAALLPRKFTNRERLNGDNFIAELGEETYNEIRDEANRIGSLARIGYEWNQLKDKYSARKMAIGHISSIDVGTPTSAYQKNETSKWDFPSWNAELVRSDLPQNVILGVSLSYRQNKLDTFPAFLQKIDGIIMQVLSVPWFSKYIADNPATEFEIRFVQDRSLSIQAKEKFIEELRKFANNNIEDGVRKVLDDSVFVQVSDKSGQWSRWLILPDRRMILWQISGPTVLKWKPEDFETFNLYDKKDWFQAKAVITPDGNIESR